MFERFETLVYRDECAPEKSWKDEESDGWDSHATHFVDEQPSVFSAHRRLGSERFLGTHRFFVGQTATITVYRNVTRIALLAPANRANNQSLAATLSWEAYPDQADALSARGVFVAYYRVFLAITDHFYYEPFIVRPERTGSNPEEPSEPLTFTTPRLARKTQYKWKIEALMSDGSVIPSEEWVFETGTGGLQFLPPTPMVEIGPEYFRMGDGLEDWETEWMGPIHNVIIGITYLMGIYEVTFDEYDAFCDETGRSKPYDNGWGRGTRPVMNVSWWDAIAYCNWLSGKMGLSPAYDANGNMITPSGQVTRNV